MKLALTLLAVGAISALSFTPANAGGFSWGGHSSSGGWSSTSGDHSSSGGKPSSSSSGGMPSSSTTSSSSSGGATSVPEPSDAVLLLMGAVGVVIGRKLHARNRRG